jgi:hypothetical protein
METYFLLSILGLTSALCTADYLLRLFHLEGRYYVLHSLHNVAIVALTAPDVYHTLTDFQNITSYSVNTTATALCFSLHFYHILWYFKKLRYDDWLHHGLMIGFALPVGFLVESHTLLGFSLFFTTGLPGSIDYFMLFLTRNYWLSRNTEKRVNSWLAVWIRSPGCVAQAALTLTWLLSYRLSSLGEYDALLWMWAQFIGGILTAFLNYWNGQYFMEQVVRDYAKCQQDVVFNSV